MKIDQNVQHRVEQHENTDGQPKTSTRATIGVVFVHGIGEQTETETVREFGGALLGWLQEWHKRRQLDVLVKTSSLSYGDEGTRPARFTISLPESTDADSNVRPAQTWILAEAWWATRLEPPGFVRLATWGWNVLWGVVSRLATHVRERYFTPIVGDTTPWLVKFVSGLSALLLILGFGLAILVAYPMIAVLFVLAQIPIPQVQEFILFKTLRFFLLTRIGDFYTFMYDDVQAVHIRETVPYAISYLATNLRCAEIVVVAHSQGTVVAFDALTSGAVPEIKKVRTLVTFGAALNNAWRVAPSPRTTRITGELPAHIRWVDFWSAYDNVSGAPTKRPTSPPFRNPDEWVEVTNSMNILMDHGGYLNNSEEFLSRLAQEIDQPVGLLKDQRTHTTSRFWPKQPAFDRWKVRRRDRVVTMVSWRVAAIVGVFCALVIRLIEQEHLRRDGETLWAGLSSIVIAGEALKWIDQSLSWLAPLEGGLANSLGIAFWAGLFTVFYIQLARFLFGNWQDRESDRSTGTTAPGANETQKRQVITRSAPAIALVTAAVFMVEGGPVLGPCSALWNCSWGFFAVAVALFVALAGAVDEITGTGPLAVRPADVFTRQVLWWLASALVLFAVLSLVLGPFAVARQTAGTTLPEMWFLAPPQQVYDFVAGLEEAARRTYRAALWLDFGLPVLYMLVFGGIAWLLARRNVVAPAAWIGVAAVILAGLLDVAENVALLLISYAQSQPDWVWLVPAITSLKIFFLAVTIGAAAVIPTVLFARAAASWIRLRIAAPVPP